MRACPYEYKLSGLVGLWWAGVARHELAAEPMLCTDAAERDIGGEGGIRTRVRVLT